MLSDDDLTTQQLLAAWRRAEGSLQTLPVGTAEHDEAVRRSEEARDAYRARIEAMKADLRDG